MTCRPVLAVRQVVGGLGLSGGTDEQGQQVDETALSSLGFDIAT